MPISELLARLILTPGAPPIVPTSIHSDEAVIRAAAIHGVGPLLALRNQGHDIGLSDGVAEWAAHQIEFNLQRQALLLGHLTLVLEAFQAAAIEIVPLKGAALLLRDGDGVAWRPMADLDVLITVPHQRAVDLAIAHAGFCLSSGYNTGWSGLAWKHLEYQLCDHVWPTISTLGEHPELPRKLEAHFAVRELYRGIGFDLTGHILNDLVHAGDARVPGDNALALHLTVHASFAIFERKLRLSNLVDLQQLLTPDAIQAIAGIVRVEGARRRARFLYPALALLTRFAPTALLSRFAAALQPYTPRPLVAWIERSSLAELSYEAGRGQPWLLPDSYLATSRSEELKLAMNRWLPLPRDLSNAGYLPSSRMAMLGWYQDYYRRQARALLRAERFPGARAR
jgi:hypothetical protein